MSMRCQKMPGGVPFSTLQATVQALHPTQRSRSITIPYLMVTSSGLVDLHLGRGIERASDRLERALRDGHQAIEAHPFPGYGVQTPGKPLQSAGESYRVGVNHFREADAPLRLAVRGLHPDQVPAPKAPRAGRLRVHENLELQGIPELGHLVEQRVGLHSGNVEHERGSAPDDGPEVVFRRGRGGVALAVLGEWPV